MRGSIGAGPIAAAMLAAVICGAFTTPAPGSAERRAIMDAIRPRAEADLGGPVQFHVRTLHVQDGWAYASVDPQKPGGAPYRINRPEPMNAYAGALLQRRGGAWRVVEWRLGPTDVWYLNYCASTPRGLLEGC